MKGFGTERMEDAREAYAQPSAEIQQMGQDQVTGSAGGFRKTISRRSSFKK